MSKATFVFADHQPMNSSYYRVLYPAKFLRKAGHDIDVVHVDSVRQVNEVLMVERNLNENDLAMYQAMGAKRIVYTFDDAYRVIPSATASTPYWRGDKQMALDLAPVIRKIHKAIVPSQSLANHYNAIVIPNFHDPSLVVDKIERNDGNIVIGWGGSSGHYVTWQNDCFLQALNKICKEFDNVVVKMIGGFNIGIGDFNHEYKRWVSFEEWKSVVASFDIGIAPLHGKYDEYRSNLKIVEYGLAGVPFVASHYDEYAESAGGILVDNTSKAWYKALRVLVRDEIARKTYGQLGKLWAQKYLFQDLVDGVAVGNADAVKMYEGVLFG